MIKIINTVLVVLLSLGLGSAAYAAEYTKGTVKKLDEKGSKVTIKHEELKNLGMPAMTMVFKISKDVDIKKLKEGGAVEFVADRVQGNLTVVEVK